MRKGEREGGGRVISKQSHLTSNPFIRICSDSLLLGLRNRDHIFRTCSSGLSGKEGPPTPELLPSPPIKVPILPPLQSH